MTVWFNPETLEWEDDGQDNSGFDLGGEQDTSFPPADTGYEPYTFLGGGGGSTYLGAQPQGPLDTGGLLPMGTSIGNAAWNEYNSPGGDWSRPGDQPAAPSGPSSNGPDLIGGNRPLTEYEKLMSQDRIRQTNEEIRKNQAHQAYLDRALAAEQSSQSAKQARGEPVTAADQARLAAIQAELENSRAQTAIAQQRLSQDMTDRKSTRLNSSHSRASRMPSSA